MPKEKKIGWGTCCQCQTETDIHKEYDLCEECYNSSFGLKEKF